MTTKNAMEMTAAEFDAAVRSFEHREHWAREKAVEDGYVAGSLKVKGIRI